MLSLKYSLYDCFAEAAFQGHTAAIVEFPDKPDLKIAAKIAQELCQTVTCFVWKKYDEFWVETLAKDGNNWPINHGLLGVARHLLGPMDEGILHTENGSVQVKTIGNTITIFLPKLSLDLKEMPDRLNQAFDTTPVLVRETGKTCVVELRTIDEVINLETDFNRIAKLDYDRIVLTAEDQTLPFDFVCRYFSPKHNIDENNGSLYIQTFLPLFWQERLHKDDFSFLQLSSRRAMGKARIAGDMICVEAPVFHAFEGVLKIS